MPRTPKQQRNKRKAARHKKKRRQSAVNRAGQLLKIAKVGDNSTMGVADAMRFAGFNTGERQDKGYQKQVTRRRDKLQQEEAVKQLLPVFHQQAQSDSAPAVAVPAATSTRAVDVRPIIPVKLKAKQLRQTNNQAMESRRALANKKNPE